ncbi:putative bifunctional diguanylate cyclase/phosphodiesterase [Methylobacterium segetis]|uniref:putative bifunctional diguanylate cyclase/phosphodiesterase n=1 Tax=Methylobacterium segetis TaxID=2488750 RepID=UPI001FDFDB22|nr:EAL domain-containing protein [Methylobacterium segetis]
MFPVAPGEADRVQALHALKILDTAPEAHFDAICRTAAALFGAPVALVSLVSEDRQWFKARCGLGIDGTARDVAFCSYAILSQEAFVVEDATRDPRFRESPLVTEHGVRFYAGAPLILGPGLHVGSFCVMDVVPRTFRPEETRQLQDLAAVVVAQLRLHRAEQDLREREERLRLALRAGRMVAWERDLRTGHATRSDNAQELLGIGSGPISLILDRVHSEDRPHVERFSAYGGTLDAVEFRYRTPEGRQLWLCMRAEQTEPDRIVGITFDITDRKLSEARLWRAANHDPLTGLPNRALFQERFRDALAQAEETGARVGLILIDIDDFKDVNDTLGHDAGDALLTEMAVRLTEMARPGDTVARLGGDEFAVILAGSPRLEAAAVFAGNLLERLRQPFAYRGRPLATKASMGLACFPDHHRLPDELMKDADIALYRAKASGRNRVTLYAPEMRALTEKRVAVSGQMQEALLGGQIVPFYQPKVCLATGRIVGFEALARWLHPVEGVLAPGYFGSAFEDPELAHAIGSRIVARVAADMRAWRARGLDFGRVAVNVSSAEFHRPDLAEATLAALQAQDVPPTCLEIEVTETVFLGRGSDFVSGILRRFHESGVTLALDDFGTGYASLTHLKQFPVDHIKIDQSFVRGLEQDGDDAAIVAAVIGLGRALDTRVTAEGVESQGQVRRLRAMGCGFAQGYLYAKPMAGSRVPWLIGNWPAIAAGLAEEAQATAPAAPARAAG